MKIFGTALSALAISAPATFAGGLGEPAPAPVLAAPVAVSAPAFDWSGAYAGLTLGFSQADGSTTGTVPVASRTEYDLDGSLVGFHLGYLWQTGTLIYGVEADVERWSLSGNDGGAGGVTDGFEADWLASVRGRVGAAAGRTLFYGTLGLQAAQLDIVQASTAPAATGSTGFAATGWTAGLGLEHVMSDRATIGLEYRYMAFPDGFDTPDNATSFARTHEMENIQSVRLRLAYRF